MVLGTPAYMSPEQLLGRPEDVDVRSDVHALGVLLYETLTGRLPRDLGDGSLGAAIRALRESRPKPPESVDPSIPRDLGAVCLQALDADPARRYASVADVAADLERWLAGKPVTARPAGPLRAAGMWVRRHAAASFLAAALLIALVGGSVLALTIASRERSARESAVAQRDRAEGFLRAGNDFVPWILETHQRHLAGLPRSGPVVRSLVAGVRAHLKALSYEKATDPDLLLTAARSYARLAEIEGGFGIDAIGLREEAREDAEAAAGLANRVRAIAPVPETFEIEGAAHLLLSRLDKAKGDFEGAKRHSAAATAAAEAERAFQGDRPSGPALDLRLQAGMLRAEILEQQGDVRGGLDANLRALDDLPKTGDVVPAQNLRLEIETRIAFDLLSLGREPESRPHVDRLAEIAGDWEKATGFAVDARSELFRSYLRLADAATSAGASAVPWFERALAALARWREVARGSAFVDRAEAEVLRRHGAVVLEEGRYADSMASHRRAQEIAWRLVKDDPGDAAAFEILLEARLNEAETDVRLGREAESAKVVANADSIGEQIGKSFPDAKEAWVSKARIALTKAAIDTIHAEGVADAAKRRVLLERAVALTLDGARSWREAASHGTEQGAAEEMARLCEAEVERLRREIGASR
jgi:tetratricopeptide (TPR) repeat protein